MKTLEEVEREMQEIKDTPRKGWTESQCKKGGRRLTFLTKARNYLEFENTSEQLARRHMTDQNAIVLGLSGRYKEWCAHTDLNGIKNPVQKFRTEVGITAINKKLKILEYVLD